MFGRDAVDVRGQHPIQVKGRARMGSRQGSTGHGDSVERLARPSLTARGALSPSLGSVPREMPTN